MHNVVSPAHFEMARRFRAIHSRYQKGRDLVQLGAYVGGSDPGLDEAIQLNQPMDAFLQQGMQQGANLQDSHQGMRSAMGSEAELV